MTDPEPAAAPESRRRLGRWQRAALGGAAAAAAVIVAGAGFLAFGPDGMGPGPLSVGYVASSGIVPPDDSTMIIVPVGAATATGAVIDAVGIRGGGGYHAPAELRVVGVPGQACRGIWFPVAGAAGFAGQCAPGGTVPLLGRAVPRHAAAASIDIGIEVGPPGAAGCWGISRVSVHYHVGHRHYLNVAAESLSGCKSA